MKDEPCEYSWHTLEDVQKTDDKRCLVAIGLTSWAACMSGAYPPPHFGDMMVLLGRKLDIAPTPDEFDRLAKEMIG